MNTLIWYPKCSTCKKAKQYLTMQKIPFQERHIKENPPTKEELHQWMIQSQLPIRKFFNTSGILYREMKLKDKLDAMTLEEQIQQLASDGMLIKRPLFIGSNQILLGFKIHEWQTILS